MLSASGSNSNSKEVRMIDLCVLYIPKSNFSCGMITENERFIEGMSKPTKQVFLQIIRPFSRTGRTSSIQVSKSPHRGLVATILIYLRLTVRSKASCLIYLYFVFTYFADSGLETTTNNWVVWSTEICPVIYLVLGTVLSQRSNWLVHAVTTLSKGKP